MKFDDEYVYLECDDIAKLKFKKVTGHSFVGLIGFDPYNKPGDTLLYMHNILPNVVDPKYLKRGDYAEEIVLKVYKRDYPEDVIIRYDNKEAIKYDNFKDQYINLGGIIDIENITKNTIIEVKSKSMKDYEKINQIKPLNEVYQGLLYTYLRKYKQLVMEWVFFDEESENAVFEGKRPKTNKNLKKISYPIECNHDEMKKLCAKALKVVQNFRRDYKIKLSDISPKNIELLKKGIQ